MISHVCHLTGLSVVDYILVAHEILHWFNDFSVIRSKDLFTQASTRPELFLTTLVILLCSCSMVFPAELTSPSPSTIQRNEDMVSFTAFNLSSIPDHFPSSVSTVWHSLGAPPACQLTVDAVYTVL